MRHASEFPIFDPEDWPRPLVWEDLFRFQGPIEIEVGCGKGRFLLSQATQHPDTCYVGLEYARAYLLATAQRAAKLGLMNVRVARCEADSFCREYVKDASISAFHLLYPDPWPKKRHHKRRLIRHDFLAELRRVLAPGAILNIATDHSGYFEWMLEQFEAWKGTFLMEPRILSSPEDRKGFEGRTNYESKYLHEGRVLYFLEGTRTAF